MRKKRLGDLLIETGMITDEQLQDALYFQRSNGKKLGEILIEENIITEEKMIEVLEFQLGVPHLDLEKYPVEYEAVRLISESLAKKHLLIPVKKEHKKLIVAMADPMNIYAMDDISIATGMDVEPAIATKKDILDAIERYYGKRNAARAVEEYQREQLETLPDFEDEDDANIANSPVVRLVNNILIQAINDKASDIHIEPYEDSVRIRCRIDGSLRETMTVTKTIQTAMTTRIKIMGKMDIAEKRIPQDGRIEIKVKDHDIDMRISTLPTVHGEKVVIRILNRFNFLMSKETLGFIDQNLALLKKIIKSPNGIILVTGPTGSGKSTTLYSILNDINSVGKNIITVEDPVEYNLEGITQVQVNQKAGLTFSVGLRSILRQDPDVIFLGEVRDEETAQIAVRAAITGHLVLSSIHTNDAASTVTRLIDIGIDPYLVATSLVGVVSQRLVRKVCTNCKREYTVTKEEQKTLDVSEGTKIYRGSGCTICNRTGYKGRIAIHEIMPINREIRALVVERAINDVVHEAALRNGMISLKDNCKRLVLQGTTTIEELLKVTYSVD